MEKKSEQFDSRKYMLMAIDEMNKSIAEPRQDGKVSPKVGAVIVLPDGKVDASHRGELRLGDHAEFTLLEKKNRSANLTGSILFATLEPCAPGARKHPKLGCAERIVNARIKEVWVGCADPDPDVDRKGIQYLKDNGIIVRMFPPDLQKIIKEVNNDFFKQAYDRADGIEVIPEPILLSLLENVVEIAENDWYDENAINYYLKESKRNFESFSELFWNHFAHIGMVKKIETEGIISYKPTGFGMLLFGKNRDLFPQAVVHAKFTFGNDKPKPKPFDMPLVLMPAKIEEWLIEVLDDGIDRSSFKRENKTKFPIEPLREAIINAIVHRDYGIDAKTFIEIDDDKVVVKSAGLPIDPISLQEVQQFRAPSLSRNPKIAYVFNRMEIMEESELGMSTYKTMNQHFNLPSPFIDFKEPYLVVTFPRTTDAVKKLYPNKKLTELSDEEVLGYEYIKTLDGITKRDYVQHFGYNDKKAQRHLSKFVKLGLIEPIGVNTGNYKLADSIS